MTTKAKELAVAIETIEANLNKIYSMIGDIAVNGDFNFVNIFQDEFKLSLKGANTVLETTYGTVKDKLHTLANVLYIREMESIKPKSDWREHVNANRRVSAVKSLREFIGPENLTLGEGVRVIELYTAHPF